MWKLKALSDIRCLSNTNKHQHIICCPNIGIWRLRWNSWTYKRLESFAPCYLQFFYWQIFKETRLCSGFKNTYKKPRNKKTRVYSWIAPCRPGKNEGRNSGKNSSLQSEKTRVYAQKPRLKMLFKNFISGKVGNVFNIFRYQNISKKS